MTMALSEMSHEDAEREIMDLFANSQKQTQSASKTSPPCSEQLAKLSRRLRSVSERVEENAKCISEPNSAKSIDHASEVSTVEIAYGDMQGTYQVKPIANLFPILEGVAFQALKHSISTSGQQHPLVFDGRTLLDGRNRLRALNELKLAPKIVQFKDLSLGTDPSRWILATNLDRRSLSDDQRLAITVSAQLLLRAESPIVNDSNEEIREKSAGIEFPQDPAETPKRRPGRPNGLRSDILTLAKACRQSRYRCERILCLRVHRPELLFQVQQGSISLKAAMRQLEELQNRAKSPAECKALKVKQAIRCAKIMLIKQERRLAEPDREGFWQAISAFIVSRGTPKTT